MAEDASSPARASSFVRFEESANDGRYYGAAVNGGVWDYQPGDSFTVTVQWGIYTNNGLAPVQIRASVIRVKAHLPNGGAQIGSTRTVTVSSDSGSQDLTFHMDDDPGSNSSGSPRSGMIELVVEVEKTNVPTWGPVTSRGSGTPPAGVSLFTWRRGYYRSRVVLSDLKVSNVSLGSAEPATFAVPDNIYLRSDMSADWYRSLAFGYDLRQGATQCRTSSVTATTARRDDTYNATATTVGGKGRVNKGLFAVDSTGTKVRLTLPTNSFGVNNDREYAWADTGHRAGYTRVDDATLDYADEITVDPRITFSQLLQHNDSAWGTPPSSKNVANGRRLTSDLSRLAARATNARGEGLANSLLVWDEKLWSTILGDSEGAPTHTRSSTTTTQGGELGWSDAFMVWDNGLPGGSWFQKEVITTTEFQGLEASNTRTLTLLAFDSGMIRSMLEGDLSTPLDHWYPGKPLAIGVAAMKNGLKQTIDSARIWLTRPKIGALGDVTTESLQSDRTTWATGDPGDTHAHALSASADDAKVFRMNFTAAETNAWASYYDIAIAGEIVIGGTPYPVQATLSVMGSRSRHGQSFDLYIGAGPAVAPGRHTVVGEDVTIGIGLRGSSGITAMDASSAQWAATRFHPVNGVLQFWNNTTGAWVTTGTPIYNAATIGAVGTEPLLAWATLPAAAIDLTGNIRILAKATKTPSGSVVAEPYESSFDMPVVGSKWKHDTNEPEASVDFDAAAGHSHWGQSGPGSNELSGRFVPRAPP